ncbi:SubName: Full=Uncharacterized protein {ECO:0000313/EMBL:CCA72035.1} [Serendipita indica DSM 11827]|nr:SubName: Full=Uncharacterized protein {ECO:0000313/EMBL:CCA72035.1} [Serendipita indica DSM 11827]
MAEVKIGQDATKFGFECAHPWIQPHQLHIAAMSSDWKFSFVFDEDEDEQEDIPTTNAIASNGPTMSVGRGVDDKNSPIKHDISDYTLLARDLDIGTRKETVSFIKTPWTIAKQHAATRSRNVVPMKQYSSPIKSAHIPSPLAKLQETPQANADVPSSSNSVVDHLHQKSAFQTQRLNNKQSAPSRNKQVSSSIKQFGIMQSRPAAKTPALSRPENIQKLLVAPSDTADTIEQKPYTPVSSQILSGRQQPRDAMENVITLDYAAVSSSKSVPHEGPSSSVYSPQAVKRKREPSPALRVPVASVTNFKMQTVDPGTSLSTKANRFTHSVTQHEHSLVPSAYMRSSLHDSSDVEWSTLPSGKKQRTPKPSKSRMTRPFTLPNNVLSLPPSRNPNVPISVKRTTILTVYQPPPPLHTLRQEDTPTTPSSSRVHNRYSPPSSLPPLRSSPNQSSGDSLGSDKSWMHSSWSRTLARFDHH